MTAINCRRFTIADLMILIAATAIGLAESHVFLVILSSHSGRTFKVGVQILPCLTAWTLGFFAIRLRKPRPKRRHLMRQPGMVACCSLGFLMMMMGPPIWIFKFASGGFGIGTFFVDLLWCLLFLLPSGGALVLVSWGILSIGGRWRRESGWIDWLGIWLGIGWIMLSLTRLYDGD